MKTNIGTHSQKLCTMRDLETVSPKWDFFLSNLSPQRTLNQRAWRIPRNQDPLNWYDQSSYELTETEKACTGLTQFCTISSMYIMTSSLMYSWDFWVCKQVTFCFLCLLLSSFPFVCLSHLRCDSFCFILLCYILKKEWTNVNLATKELSFISTGSVKTIVMTLGISITLR